MKKNVFLTVIALFVLMGCSAADEAITGRFEAEARTDIRMDLFPLLAIEVDYEEGKYIIKLIGDRSDPDITKEWGEDGIFIGEVKENKENVYNIADVDFYLFPNEIIFEAFGQDFTFIRR